MIKADARKTARRIVATSDCRIVGYRHYGPGSWGIDVKDPRTGDTFVVDQPTGWEERLRSAVQ